MVGFARRVTVHPVCLSEVLGYFERNTGHMLTYIKSSLASCNAER